MRECLALVALFASLARVPSGHSALDNPLPAVFARLSASAPHFAPPRLSISPVSASFRSRPVPCQPGGLSCRQPRRGSTQFGRSYVGRLARWGSPRGQRTGACGLYWPAPLNERLLAKVINEANTRRDGHSGCPSPGGGDGCLSHHGRNCWNFARIALQGTRSRSGECARSRRHYNKSKWPYTKYDCTYSGGNVGVASDRLYCRQRFSILGASVPAGMDVFPSPRD
jgi:hypothetical protein